MDIKKLPNENKKELLEKSTVLYIYRPGYEPLCGQCAFIDGNKCKLLIPTDNTVSQTIGSCGMWIKGGQSNKMPYIGAVTKTEVGYIEHPGGFQCKRCDEYIPGQKGCEKVDKNSKGDTPGQIHPDACCNRWQKKKNE